ncbi:MAG: hypothetical protein IJS31_05670, partial [Oscillospiraceae bacterium]|nr:hypothetical protein [Oscillospiraceae bacterium]
MPVNGTYYVVEAVPDTNTKQMRVVTAYMQKNSESIDQVLNMEQNSPQPTSKPPVGANASANLIIPTSSEKSNSENLEDRTLPAPGMVKNSGAAQASSPTAALPLPAPGKVVFGDTGSKTVGAISLPLPAKVREIETSTAITAPKKEKTTADMVKDFTAYLQDIYALQETEQAKRRSTGEKRRYTGELAVRGAALRDYFSQNSGSIPNNAYQLIMNALDDSDGYVRDTDTRLRLQEFEQWEQAISRLSKRMSGSMEGYRTGEEAAGKGKKWSGEAQALAKKGLELLADFRDNEEGYKEYFARYSDIYDPNAYSIIMNALEKDGRYLASVKPSAKRYAEYWRSIGSEENYAAGQQIPFTDDMDAIERKMVTAANAANNVKNPAIPGVTFDAPGRKAYGGIDSVNYDRFQTTDEDYLRQRQNVEHEMEQETSELNAWIRDLEDKQRYFSNGGDIGKERWEADDVLLTYGLDPVPPDRENDWAAYTAEAITDYLKELKDKRASISKPYIQRIKMLEGTRSLERNAVRDFEQNIISEEDFAENSGYRSKGDSWRQKHSSTDGSYHYSKVDIDAIRHAYINKDPAAISVVSMGHAAGVDSDLQYMTDDEIALYNYLDAKAPEKAEQYLNSLERELNARYRAAYQKHLEEKYAGEKGTWYIAGDSIATVLTSPLKLFSLLGQVVDVLDDGIIDQNAEYNRISTYSIDVRSKAAQQIAHSADGWTGYLAGFEINSGELAAFGYQQTMSMLDFLYNALLTGGLGSVTSSSAAFGKIAKHASLTLMASGAAADSVTMARDSGMLSVRALILGIAAGAAEYLSEMYSLETLLNADLRNESAIKYILKNIAAESSEEAASDLMNWFADDLYDVLASQSQSEWKRTIREYRAKGFSESEAFAEAFKSRLVELSTDAIGGAISGGLMSGGSVAINSLRNVQANGEAAQSAEKSTATVEGNSERNDARYSIKNTRNIPWKKQVSDYFTNNGSISSSDSLYLGNSTLELSERGISISPLYVPTSVINKAIREKKGSRSAHGLTENDIAGLSEGIQNPVAIIHNSARNALVYVTGDTSENGGYIIVTFDLNNDLYGENAHKATSIHSRASISGLLQNLDKQANIYIKNEKKFNQMLSGTGIQSSQLLAKVEFLNTSIPTSSEKSNSENLEDRTLPAPGKDSPSAAEGGSSPEGGAIAKRLTAPGMESVLALGESGTRGFQKTLADAERSGASVKQAAEVYARVYNAVLSGEDVQQAKQDAAKEIPQSMIEAAQTAAEADAERKAQAAYKGKDAILVRDKYLRKANLKSRDIRVLDALAKVTGVQIRFVEQLGDGDYNASYKDGVIQIALNAKDPVRTAITHELVHRIRETAPEAYAQMARFVQQNMSELHLSEEMQRRAELYET